MGHRFCRPGTGVFWLMGKGAVRKIDFNNPAQVKETPVQPGSADDMPGEFRDAVKRILTIYDIPAAEQEACCRREGSYATGTNASSGGRAERQLVTRNRDAAATSRSSAARSPSVARSTNSSSTSSLGDDVGIALDYRYNATEPRVVGGDWHSKSGGIIYPLVADSFAEFCKMIGPCAALGHFQQNQTFPGIRNLCPKRPIPGTKQESCPVFTNPLHIWLLSTAVLGLIANFALIKYLFHQSKGPVRGRAAGFVCGLSVHLAVMCLVFGLVQRFANLSTPELERVSYYTGPAVLAFLSIPVAVITCYWWDKRYR
jgi:hypothetical protein